MESNKNQVNKKNMIEAFQKYVLNSRINNFKELYSKNEKYINFLYAYATKHIHLYLYEYNKKSYIIRRRNLLYLKKLFIKNNLGEYKYKNEVKYEAFGDLIFMLINLFSYIILIEVLKNKSRKNNNELDKNYKELDLLNKLLSNFIHIVLHFYSIQMMKDENLEVFFKFLIYLSIASNNAEPPNQNDNIVNSMFLVQSIKAIKMIFNKIYQSKNEFNEIQKKIMNNIIIFCKDNIIGYFEKKPLNIINKFFLCNNDYYTTCFMDLIFIIVKMKNEEIITNLKELLCNIYIFSFNNENIMSQLLKIIQPLLLNFDKKSMMEINQEIDIIHFIINFIKELIQREEQMLNSEPILREGFFLGNKFCGVTSEIDSLEDEFSLIFGFCLFEKSNKMNSKNEWTLINIRSKENKNKEKMSQIKIGLSKINNSNNQYNLLISDNTEKQFETGIIINSKCYYIFSFNFIKNKSVKISYKSDNNQEINKIKEINLKFNIDNTNIYIGCDVHKKSLIEEQHFNTFFGYIGTVIILNNKKLSKKGKKEDEITNIDLILQLKGDYAKCILICLDDNDSKKSLINNEDLFHSKNSDYNKNILNRLNEIYENSKIKFVEVIKTFISPNSFKSMDYKDEIDYLNSYNNYKVYERNVKKIKEVRQNYLNLDSKKSSSKIGKTIKIFNPFFNNRFHIFENKLSIEEFIKYDGIFYFGLLLEYYYQILFKIKKEDKFYKDILEKIKINIIEILIFFNNNIINIHYIKYFSPQIDNFFYQITATLKQYINIKNIIQINKNNNSINDEIFKSLEQIIENLMDLGKDDTIDADLNDKIYKLKSKMFGLLHDILTKFYQNPDYNCYIIEKYISIYSKLLTQGKLEDFYSNEFIDEFLGLSLIFEKNFSFFKNANLEIIISIRKLYEDFLIKLLMNIKIKINYPLKSKLEEQKNSSIFKKNKKVENMKEEKIEKNNEYLNHYIEFALKNERFQDIFSNLLNIVYKAGLIPDVKPIYIDQIKIILLKFYKKKDKNIVSEACLKTLLIYSLSNQADEEKIHNFLKTLEYDKRFFYSVIASVKQILKFLSNNDKQIQSSNNPDSKEQKVEIGKNSISEESKNEIYPLLDIDLNNLNKKQKKTLKKLFQDCISMLKPISNFSNKTDANDIYNCFKKNFDEVLKYPGKNVYKSLFDSESQISPELYFFKFKNSNDEEKNILLHDLKAYHNELLKYHSFPFIFKFILLIDSDPDWEEKDGSKIDYIFDLLEYLISEFEKNIDKKINMDFYHYINNIINYIVLINKLILNEEQKVIYFSDEKFKEKFKEIFYKLISLLQITGLLYSNYCFEIDESFGKLISEMCFDMFISFLDTNFNDKDKENFAKIFFINDKQKKVIYCIFYLMDLNKDEVLRSEKNKKDKKVLNEIKDKLKCIDNYQNLKYIQENMFISNDIKVFGKKINKIEGVNFSAFFLAKTFLYWKEINTDNLKKFLMDTLLPSLSGYLYSLYTQYTIFYGHKILPKFLLYKETKDFFESRIGQLSDKFNLYKDFFNKDIPVKLNGQDKIKFCYGSRLLNINKEDINVKEENENSTIILNDSNSIIIPNSSFPLPSDNKYFQVFDRLKNKDVILNPKNYFLKIIFSNIFKDLFFKDKIFQKIKKKYISKYKSYEGFDIRTKQIEYPTMEKNFSNSLEPKTFLRRDYKFYNNKFFPVSHEYILPKLISDRDDNKLFFYNHNFERDITNEKEFKCELITNRLLYFGNICFHKDYIYFKTENDKRDDKNSKEKENIYSNYIFSTKDNENKANKEKEIIMFVNDIVQIIRKRTLLMNQSLEIFNKNGKSFFFNLFKVELCEQACDFLKKNCKIVIEEGNKESIKHIISLFKKGEISNYDYLLNLNKLSTRTYNDLSQYPIFPWIVKNIPKLLEKDDINNYSLNKIEEKEKDKSENEPTKESDIYKEEDYYRDMNFPISMQKQDKRENEIEKYKDDEKSIKFPYHLGTHYSTSSYIFYYKMRNNPYCQNLIKLQNYKQENPNRMFLSFKDTQKILQTSTDNRELIPDLFCYVDYFCNVNCAFFGLRSNDILVDDFSISEIFNTDTNKYYNTIYLFVKYLYVHKKLLNDAKTSREISKWVDIIFGKKQLPENKEERAKSCNVFGKLTYEQNMNFEDKLKIYIKRFEEAKNNKDLEKKFINKIQNRINIIINFGICPKQILFETVYNEGNSNINPIKLSKKELNLNKPDLYLYFSKAYGKYISIYESEKDKIKKVKILDNIDAKESTPYICGIFENNISKFYEENEYPNILYKSNYVISLITLKNLSNINETIVLTCRYLGNYFKVQNSFNKEIIIICEDFVTTIVSRYSKKEDNIFFTGLKNGKLIQWEFSFINENPNTKKKKDKSSSFTVNEINHIYDHKSSITAIEINNKKQIIATAGEDNYIHIRKLYDFEILTVIDLTYCYANPIVSKSKNIFPSMIKISDLNCIYILFYDFDTKTTIIRGYTLNGLFFAQTENDDKEKSFYTNITLSKNGNVIVGLYNKNKILKLNSFDLKIRAEKLTEREKKINWVEIDYSNNIYIVLSQDCVKFIPIKDEIKQN